MHHPKCIVNISAIVGECPTWCEETNVLYWIDIRGKKIHRYHPEKCVNETFNLPEIVTSLALCKNGQLILSLRKSIALYTISIAKLDVLATIEANKAHNRFNDGKCDPQGRFWVGTMDDQNWMNPNGTLYKFNPDQTINQMQTNITCSNGMGWSPDKRTLYFTDSFRYVINAYDYDPGTGLSNPRHFVKLNSNEGVFPDGLTVDSEGFVWSAQVGSGQVVRYDPDGCVERIIQLPVPRVTSCTFGGPDLTTLYITSATETMSESQLLTAPLSGGLFAIETEITGLPTYRFG